MTQIRHKSRIGFRRIFFEAVCDQNLRIHADQRKVAAALIIPTPDWGLWYGQFSIGKNVTRIEKSSLEQVADDVHTTEFGFGFLPHPTFGRCSCIDR